jgi:hypothetical protein
MECPICFAPVENKKQVVFACCCQKVCMQCHKKIAAFKNARCPYCNHTAIAVEPQRIEETPLSAESCRFAVCFMFCLLIPFLIFIIVSARGRLVN